MKKTQSLHSLLVSQSTNFLDLDFSVAKQDKVDRGYNLLTALKNVVPFSEKNLFTESLPAILLLFQFYLTPDIRIF